MHRLLLTLTAACLLGCLPPVSGQSLATGSAPTWSVTPAVVSNYLFRGVRLGGASFQPTVEAAWSDASVGLWSSVPLDNKVPDVETEYDLYASYTASLTPATSWVVGATWYTYPGADRAAGYYRHTLEPSVGFNYTVHGVRFTPKVYYDLMLEGATAEIAAAYAWPLQTLGTELNLTASWGTFKSDNATENATPAVRNWGDYWSAGIAVPFQVTTASRVTAGFTYQRGYNHYTQQGGAPKASSNAAVGRGAVSLAWTVTF